MPRAERGVQLNTTHPLRRNLAAATTACTIVCTVLGGALMSANTTHAAPAPISGGARPDPRPGARGPAGLPAADPYADGPAQQAAADRYADRLAELRDARAGHAPPGAADVAAGRPESATVAPDARPVRASRASGRRGASSGDGDAGDGDGRDGRTRDGGARDIRTRDGDGRDGGAFDGGVFDGGARDGGARGEPGTARRRPGSRQHASAAGPAAPGAGSAVDGGFPPGADAGVVAFALAQVGKAYSFGRSGPDAFDCSGLVAAAFRMIGLYLPHSTYDLARRGRPVQQSELRPGDLVFPSTGHVGIYVGNGLMVHASTERGGVKVSSVYAFQFARRVAG